MTTEYRHKRHMPSLCVTCAGQSDRHERHTPLGGVTSVTLARVQELPSWKGHGSSTDNPKVTLMRKSCTPADPRPF